MWLARNRRVLCAADIRVNQKPVCRVACVHRKHGGMRIILQILFLTALISVCDTNKYGNALSMSRITSLASASIMKSRSLKVLRAKASPRNRGCHQRGQLGRISKRCSTDSWTHRWSRGVNKMGLLVGQIEIDGFHCRHSRRQQLRKDRPTWS
jgi:hypothetical protein